MIFINSYGLKIGSKLQLKNADFIGLLLLVLMATVLVGYMNVANTNAAEESRPDIRMETNSLN